MRVPKNKFAAWVAWLVDKLLYKEVENGETVTVDPLEDLKQSLLEEVKDLLDKVVVELKEAVADIVFPEVKIPEFKMEKVKDVSPEIEKAVEGIKTLQGSLGRVGDTLIEKIDQLEANKTETIVEKHSTEVLIPAEGDDEKRLI